MVSPLRVPTTVTGKLRRALKAFGLEKAVFVDRVPSVGSRQGACIWNVKDKVAFEGGKALSGWALREWRGCFFEAEQHVVWASRDNNILDVTPHPYDDTTAFAEDPTVRFDHHGLAQSTNRYFNIAEGRRRQIVDQLIDASLTKQRYEIANKRVVDGVVEFVGDHMVMDELLSRMRLLAERLPRRRSS